MAWVCGPAEPLAASAPSPIAAALAPDTLVDPSPHESSDATLYPASVKLPRMLPQSAGVLPVISEDPRVILPSCALARDHRHAQSGEPRLLRYRSRRRV